MCDRIATHPPTRTPVFILRYLPIAKIRPKTVHKLPRYPRFRMTVSRKHLTRMPNLGLWKRRQTSGAHFGHKNQAFPADGP